IVSAVSRMLVQIPAKKSPSPETIPVMNSTTAPTTLPIAWKTLVTPLRNVSELFHASIHTTTKPANRLRRNPSGDVANATANNRHAPVIALIALPTPDATLVNANSPATTGAIAAAIGTSTGAIAANARATASSAGANADSTAPSSNPITP